MTLLPHGDVFIVPWSFNIYALYAVTEKQQGSGANMQHFTNIWETMKRKHSEVCLRYLSYKSNQILYKQTSELLMQMQNYINWCNLRTFVELADIITDASVGQSWKISTLITRKINKSARGCQPLTRPLMLSGRRPIDILWSVLSSICHAATVMFPTRWFSADLPIWT